MKRIVNAILLAVFLILLLIVCSTVGRHTVIPVQNEPEQVEQDGQSDKTEENTAENINDDSKKDFNQTADEEMATEDDAGQLRIGVILIGDETENYSKAHIDAIVEAARTFGIEKDEIEWKERIDTSDDSYDAVAELLDDGCNLVIANSPVQQDAFMDAAEKNPDAAFVVIGGAQAALSGLNNYYNAYTDIYEARYLSGVVAGMKLAQLKQKNKISKYGYDAFGNVRVGYIGTYRDAEVISGYTAFYLGMKSVMDHVTMQVYYTNDWMNMDAEATAADKLIRSGCVLIAQHGNSDSAAETIEKAWKSGRHVYYIGYSENASEVAPDATLTSAVSHWNVYYTKLLTAVSQAKEFPHDWSGGLKKGAVSLTKLGSHVAPKTSAKVVKAKKQLKSGKLHVFDVSKFTVGGMQISDQDAMIDLSITDEAEEDTEVSEDDIVKSALVSFDDGVYFGESMLRSAPYFNMHIDGIIEVNVNVKE